MDRYEYGLHAGCGRALYKRSADALYARPLSGTARGNCSGSKRAPASTPLDTRASAGTARSTRRSTRFDRGSARRTRTLRRSPSPASRWPSCDTSARSAGTGRCPSMPTCCIRRRNHRTRSRSARSRARRSAPSTSARCEGSTVSSPGAWIDPRCARARQ